MTAGPGDRPRVLHVFSGDLWAGAEVMIYNLLARLHQDGRAGLRAISLNDGILVRKLGEAGVSVEVIPESRHSFPEIVRRAAALLGSERIDIIHTHRYKENLIGFLIASTLRPRRLMTTVHGLPENVAVETGKVKRSLRRSINDRLLRHGFTQVVAVSEEMKRALTERHRIRREKIRVIYNGIPPGPDPGHDGQAPREGVHIGTVGRFVPVKDFDLFLRLAAELRDRLPRVRLSILGEGPLRASLQDRARSLGVQEIVDFPPPRPDPRPFYRSLDLYVNTSLHEGIPLSILEAMACETVVVAPRVGGIPEIITHEREGLLPEERSPTSFAEACLRILGDDSLRHRMARAARQRVLERFSDEAMASSYDAAYRA